MTTGRTAIAKWRALHRPPDKHAEGVLRRLTSDRRAAKAFTIIAPAQYTAIVIVGDCVKAEMISRTFAARLLAERKMAALIDIADMGLRACRTIAMEIARPAAGVTSRLYDNGPRIEAALEELQGLIERRRMIVRVTHAAWHYAQATRSGSRRACGHRMAGRERPARHRAALLRCRGARTERKMPRN
jgi:hypothetical protein